MSATLERVKVLVLSGAVHVSRHGYQRLIAHEFTTLQLIDAMAAAEPIEDYPDYHLGPTVLALSHLPDGAPVHMVWGIEAGTDSPAVLVTAYRPEPGLWSIDFRRRKT